MRAIPPFRAEQVGSLLRPNELLQARARAKAGEITRAQLGEIEDGAIRAAVARQESIGLQVVTDGEYRRDWWHLDFLAGFAGVQVIPSKTLGFRAVDEIPPTAAVGAQLHCTGPIMVDHFRYLQGVATRTPKLTIPSPSMLHLRGGRNVISRSAYPDLEEFWVDVVRAYQTAIAHLIAAGCTYLQLDDISFAYLCDEKVRDNCRANGDDPARLPRIYADVINGVLRNRPPRMTVALHTCRGNFRSTWAAEGAYDRKVLEAMFSTDVDAFFMEFDSARAGGFEPLALLPAGKKVVLGLITTKTGELESKEAIRRRIDEAARYVPLENLCLSPQCGFASTYHGNALSADEQWRKLERVVEVAREVWGD